MRIFSDDWRRRRRLACTGRLIVNAAQHRHRSPARNHCLWLFIGLSFCVGAGRWKSSLIEEGWRPEVCGLRTDLLADSDPLPSAHCRRQEYSIHLPILDQYCFTVGVSHIFGAKPPSPCLVLPLHLGVLYANWKWHKLADVEWIDYSLHVW